MKLAVGGYNRRLVFLAFLLLALWFFGGFRPLGREDAQMWERVRAGQKALWDAEHAAGVPLSASADRHRSGFIGVEWSPVSTTLGDIRAKRTSCDPLWSARFAEWFDAEGLVAGDRIAIYSSSSFPAMLYAAVVAAETRGLDILLAVSLGSSSWGANRPDFPWPSMEAVLIRGGHMRTAAAFYTPGGGGESGRGLSRETMQTFRELAARNGVTFVEPRDLTDAIGYKTRAMLDFAPRMLVSIGGSNANLGDSELAHAIPNGLLLPGGEGGWRMGESVVAGALRADIPVLNILNIRKLARESGIPFDAAVLVKARLGIHPLLLAAGLLLFAGVLGTHRRWGWAESVAASSGKDGEKT